MIQRIQTVFLSLALILISSTLFFSWAEILGSDGTIFQVRSFEVVVQESGETLEMSMWPVGSLASIIFLLSLTSIFLYKKRIWQIRLTSYNMILSILLPVLVYFYISTVSDYLQGTVAYQLVMILPVISAVLFFLARRRIISDHLLVTSLDRIR